MAFEVTVPDRTPSRQADLVIYEDDEQRSPYFVFECKRADLSDAAFDQSIEQAVGNRNLLGAELLWRNRRIHAPLAALRQVPARRARPQPNG